MDVPKHFLSCISNNTSRVSLSMGKRLYIFNIILRSANSIDMDIRVDLIGTSAHKGVSVTGLYELLNDNS